MRLVALLLIAVDSWAITRRQPIPCFRITLGLTVLPAEVLEACLAEDLPKGEWKLVPVHMKVKSLIYGKSPGKEFAWAN